MPDAAAYRCRTCARLSHEPSGNCEHQNPEPLYAVEGLAIHECDCDLARGKQLLHLYTIRA